MKSIMSLPAVISRISFLSSSSGSTVRVQDTAAQKVEDPGGCYAEADFNMAAVNSAFTVGGSAKTSGSSGGSGSSMPAPSVLTPSGSRNASQESGCAPFQQPAADSYEIYTEADVASATCSITARAGSKLMPLAPSYKRNRRSLMDNQDSFCESFLPESCLSENTFLGSEDMYVEAASTNTMSALSSTRSRRASFQRALQMWTVAQDSECDIEYQVDDDGGASATNMYDCSVHERSASDTSASTAAAAARSPHEMGPWSLLSEYSRASSPIPSGVFSAHADAMDGASSTYNECLRPASMSDMVYGNEDEEEIYQDIYDSHQFPVVSRNHSRARVPAAASRLDQVIDAGATNTWNGLASKGSSKLALGVRGGNSGCGGGSTMVDFEYDECVNVGIYARDLATMSANRQQAPSSVSGSDVSNHSPNWLDSGCSSACNSCSMLESSLQMDGGVGGGGSGRKRAPVHKGLAASTSFGGDLQEMDRLTSAPCRDSGSHHLLGTPLYKPAAAISATPKRYNGLLDAGGNSSGSSCSGGYHHSQGAMRNVARGVKQQVKHTNYDSVAMCSRTPPTAQANTSNAGELLRTESSKHDKAIGERHSADYEKLSSATNTLAAHRQLSSASTCSARLNTHARPNSSDQAFEMEPCTLEATTPTCDNLIYVSSSMPVSTDSTASQPHAPDKLSTDGKGRGSSGSGKQYASTEEHYRHLSTDSGGSCELVNGGQSKSAEIRTCKSLRGTKQDLLCVAQKNASTSKSSGGKMRRRSLLNSKHGAQTREEEEKDYQRLSKEKMRRSLHDSQEDLLSCEQEEGDYNTLSKVNLKRFHHDSQEDLLSCEEEEEDESNYGKLPTIETGKFHHESQEDLLSCEEDESECNELSKAKPRRFHHDSQEDLLSCEEEEGDYDTLSNINPRSFLHDSQEDLLSCEEEESDCYKLPAVKTTRYHHESQEDLLSCEESDYSKTAAKVKTGRFLHGKQDDLLSWEQEQGDYSKLSEVKMAKSLHYAKQDHQMLQQDRVGGGSGAVPYSTGLPSSRAMSSSNRYSVAADPTFEQETCNMMGRSPSTDGKRKHDSMAENVLYESHWPQPGENSRSRIYGQTYSPT